MKAGETMAEKQFFWNILVVVVQSTGPLRPDYVVEYEYQYNESNSNSTVVFKIIIKVYSKLDGGMF